MLNIMRNVFQQNELETIISLSTLSLNIAFYIILLIFMFDHNFKIYFNADFEA